MSNCIKDISHEPAFSMLTQTEENILKRNSTVLQYKRGETIIKQGTFANNMLYIKKGLAKLFIEGSQKRIILTIKMPDNFLGLSSLFYEKKTYLYTATCLEECEIELFDKMAFKHVLAQNVDFANEIIKFLNHNSARIYSRLLCVTEKNARGKVADMILCLANNIFGCFEFTIPLSRQELAEFAGLSMENTIRILKEFENDNLIELKGKDFKILNAETLERISEYG
ncbi:MAG TPA: Crp/Fnr family transcriptional regulator [Bacteroidetes bacterium]|nr:Crp/Fnr family transcriptional regulator [Bacteroidota bacterium]